jgi:hypothetical protein
VTGHLHRDAFGDSSAHEISHRGSSKIMWNAAGAARLLARLPPCFRESNDSLAFDFLARALEDPRADHVFGSQAVVVGPLSFQELLERVGEGEGSALVVLRRMRVQADDARLEVIHQSSATCRRSLSHGDTCQSLAAIT